MMKQVFLSLLCLAILSSCVSTPAEESHVQIRQIDSLGWLGPDTTYMGDAVPAYTVSSERMRLSFFGWSQDEDYRFTLAFPASTSSYGRAILFYTMCGWNNRPADWDMTTQIMVHDKVADEWYEIARCITPYGGMFFGNWSRTYSMDVTEFLPLLQGDAEFKIFYCGWDATDKKAHAVELQFCLYEGVNPYGTAMWHHKVYDSTINGGNTGYRSWAYGVQPDSLGTNHSIEQPERLGERTLEVPAGVSQVLLRVCITGHGQDALTGMQGYFPGRTDYTPINVAEFDINYYTIKLNGERIQKQGVIWETNDDNYKQAGTYKYDRAGWGPGKPCNAQHWIIDQISPKGETITLDFDLDEYISKNTSPRAESVAQYYVEVDAFGYR